MGDGAAAQILREKFKAEAQRCTHSCRHKTVCHMSHWQMRMKDEAAVQTDEEK